ncbi:MAG: NAD(P)/FAD-dependent oxidoreductase [Candidatus Thermoplasmatota archaeon]
MEKYDVIVVGGGPVGCVVACRLAKAGYNALLFEEHRSIGEPLHCAGLITDRVFDLIKDDEIRETTVMNKVRGAVIHSPSGASIRLEKETPHAYIIDRVRFDRMLYERAVQAGVDVQMRSRCVYAGRISDNNVRVDVKRENERYSYQCGILVGADGAYSTIRRLFSFPQPEKMLYGMGAEITDISLEPSYINIFLGERIAPHFFAWIIPINNKGSKARVGLCVDSTAPHSLKTYFEGLYSNSLISPYIEGSSIVRYTAGVIPLGVLERTVSDNVLLVGDAAAQVKPVSGGGLYTGLLSAIYCTDTIQSALSINKYSYDTLYNYHRSWRRSIGRELVNGMRFHMVLSRLTDREIDRYIGKFNKTRVVEIINRYGDIDYPSRLAVPLLKRQPSLFRLLFKLL